MTFGLSAMVLLGLTGGIDHARLSSRHSQLQNAADAGALAAGNYLKLAVSTSAAAKGIVEDTVRSQAAPRPKIPYALQADVAPDKTSVAVTVDETVRRVFGGIVGKMRLCLLTLGPAAPGAFQLEKNAESTAQDCSLYGNSTNPQGMVGKQVNLYQGPNLYLNANYDATSVPAPKGIGPLSGKLLSQQAGQ